MVVTRSSDADGAYTHDAYDLGDPRKAFLRSRRLSRLRNALELFREFPAIQTRILDDAETAVPSRRKALLTELRILTDAFKLALHTLAHYAAVPADASSCGCGVASVLPEWLARQTQRVDLRDLQTR